MNPGTARKVEKLDIQAQDDSIVPIVSHLKREIIGQEHVIELALAAFLAGGHVLIEGPPGTGKTSLGKKLALTFGGTFRRIQMTSDLLPSDIIGIMRIASNQNDFEFRKGPIFSHFVLADELNRTSPKTQSALLEAMAENTVSVDGSTYELPNPFFVIATQNSIESFGVFPLVESQLDRFMIKISMQVPEKADELEIYSKLTSKDGSAAIDRSRNPDLGAIVDIEKTCKLRGLVRAIYLESSVLEYIADIVRCTRQLPQIIHGVSVRGGIQMIMASKGLAFLRGRNFVLPKDVKELAIPVLAHRLAIHGDEGDPDVNARAVQSVIEKIRMPQ